MIDRLSGIYGRLLAALALAGCAILMAMMVIIVADVALRNIAVPGLPRGLAWSNEISELFLYLITMCVAPWLLRQGQHIRVDILLQALPPRLAWYFEWIGDVIGLTAVHVNRVFRTLEDKKLILRDGHMIELLDMQALRKLSGVPSRTLAQDLSWLPKPLP